MQTDKIILLVFYLMLSTLNSYATQSKSQQETTYTTYLLNKHKLFVARSMEGILFAGIQGENSQNCLLDGEMPLKNGNLKCGIHTFKVRNGKLEEKHHLPIQSSFTLKAQEVTYEYPNHQSNKISTLFQCSTNTEIQNLLKLMYQKNFSCENGQKIFYEEAKISMQKYIKNTNTYHQEIQKSLKHSPLENIVADTLVYFDDKILVFERNSYLYTGGSHGMPTKQGIILSRSKGLINVYKNIDFNNHALKTLLWEKYEEYLKQLPKETPPPTETYVDFENFKISDAILLDYDGILFLYQPYEIMPYSYGIISLKIPLIELQEFEDFKNSAFRHLLTTNIKGQK
ncbi:DUF3298 and DUF4163 domain-containing protein [Helicobacter mesocricetorum]|uniref:DUF3298 and DUF4163 domain-containing protein n=1 Tax=Helicobacter mesocricetorum TaxID=87012 RepID=UPI000CF07054|nr:DUF3298 and DUF4163 domain-containing protein [Helicobacter mesocricetorum]